MVKINIKLHMDTRLTALVTLPRLAALGVYATLVATALAPLSLLNIVSSRKMKDINQLTFEEFLRGSTTLKNIYISAMTTLKPNAFKHCSVNDEYKEAGHMFRSDLSSIAWKVKPTKGVDVRNRFRYLQFGVETTILHSLGFLVGTAVIIASIPFPSSSKTFKTLNKANIGFSETGELPLYLYLATLGIIKPTAAAKLSGALSSTHVDPLFDSTSTC